MFKHKHSSGGLEVKGRADVLIAQGSGSRCKTQQARPQSICTRQDDCILQGKCWKSSSELWLETKVFLSDKEQKSVHLTDT